MKMPARSVRLVSIAAGVGLTMALSRTANSGLSAYLAKVAASLSTMATRPSLNSGFPWRATCTNLPLRTGSAPAVPGLRTVVVRRAVWA